jgi:hypothetical protein
MRDCPVLGKGLVVGVIFLFFGVALIPGITPAQSRTVRNGPTGSPLFQARLEKSLQKDRSNMTVTYRIARDIPLFKGLRTVQVNVSEIINAIQTMDPMDYSRVCERCQIHIQKDRLLGMLRDLEQKSVSVSLPVPASPTPATIGEPWYPGCFREFVALALLAVGIFIYFAIIAFLGLLSFIPTCTQGSFCYGAKCFERTPIVHGDGL